MTETEQRLEKTGTPAENRAWGKNPPSQKFAYKIPWQSQEALGINRPRVTKTALGRPRWPSRDPLGEAGGLNLYAMVGNDPVNRWDFLGMDPGGQFNSYDAAEVDAKVYFTKEAEASVEKGVLQAFQHAYRILSPSRVSASQGTDLAGFSAMLNLDKVKGAQFKSKIASDFGAYKWSRETYIVFGREKGGVIYSYNDGGKIRFSYGEYPSSMLSQSEWSKKRPLLGRMRPKSGEGDSPWMVNGKFDGNLFLSSGHKEEQLCHPESFVHTHMVRVIYNSGDTHWNNRSLSTLSYLDKLSPSDKAVADQASLGLSRPFTVVAWGWTGSDSYTSTRGSR